MESRKKVIVLVVEDNIDDSELTEFAMKQANDDIHFLLFKDGAEALNFIFARKKNGEKIQRELKLVVLDLGLPTINGLDVLKKIRADQATRMLPVVILTSSKDRQNKVDAYELGANSYVLKPDSFDGYVRKIGSLAFYWSAVNERP